MFPEYFGQCPLTLVTRINFINGQILKYFNFILVLTFNACQLILFTIFFYRIKIIFRT